MADQKVISRQTGVDDKQYKWGFEFDIESEVAPKGLNESIVRFISAKKKEPQWLSEPIKIGPKFDAQQRFKKH